MTPFLRSIKDLRRWEIGGGYNLSQGRFDGVIPIYGFNNRFLGDSTMKRNIASNGGFGAVIGFNAPIAPTGHISNIALGFQIQGNMNTWSQLNNTYLIDGTVKLPTNQLNATTLQIAAPISIDYKIGCDAIQSQLLKMGMGIGIGIMPQIYFTSLDNIKGGNQAQQSFGATPFAKAEFVFRYKVAMKLRAMYTFGDVELMNVDNYIPNYTDGPFRLTNTSQAIFSFVIMPFSRRWSETGWHNDYDTYNWNERLN